MLEKTVCQQISASPCEICGINTQIEELVMPMSDDDCECLNFEESLKY
jgi:hypothetical protein